MTFPTIAAVVVAGSKSSLDDFRSKFAPSIADADECVEIVNSDYRFGSLAEIGNRMKQTLRSDVICMMHADVSLGEGYLRRLGSRVFETRGVAGLVGLTWSGRFLWAGERTIDWMPSEFQSTWPNGGAYPISTLDPCCVVFRRDTPLSFDEATFDRAHLFVEDFCMQAHQRDLPVEIVDGAAGHLGSMAREPESNMAWIKEYNHYAARFSKKWRGQFYRVQLLFPDFEKDPGSHLP